MTTLVKACCTLALLLSSTAAQGQDAGALKRGYELNGNSMVRWGSIDLGESPAKSVRIIPITPTPAPVAVADAKAKNSLDAIADMTNPDPAPRKEKGDICTRHGLRKVVTGKAWHCRK